MKRKKYQVGFLRRAVWIFYGGILAMLVWWLFWSPRDVNSYTETVLDSLISPERLLCLFVYLIIIWVGIGSIGNLSDRCRFFHVPIQFFLYPKRTYRLLRIRTAVNAFFGFLGIELGQFLWFTQGIRIIPVGDYEKLQKAEAISQVSKCLAACFVGIILNTWFLNVLLKRPPAGKTTKRSTWLFKELLKKRNDEEKKNDNCRLRFNTGNLLDWREYKEFEQGLEKKIFEEILTRCGLSEVSAESANRKWKRRIRQSGLFGKGSRLKIQTGALTKGTYRNHSFQTGKIGLRIRRSDGYCSGSFWSLKSPQNSECEIYIFHRKMMEWISKYGIETNNLQQETDGMQPVVPEDSVLAKHCVIYSNKPEIASEFLQYETGDRIRTYMEKYPQEPFFIGIGNGEKCFFICEENDTFQRAGSSTWFTEKRFYEKYLLNGRKYENMKSVDKEAVVQAVDDIRHDYEMLDMLTAEGDSIMYSMDAKTDVDEILQDCLKNVVSEPTSKKKKKPADDPDKPLSKRKKMRRK